jgi:hypothetical protein
MRKRRLIEIAAILACAVMAFVGVVAYNRSRPREMDGIPRCDSNLKQLTLAILQYVQDYDETLPWRTGATAPGDAWRDLGMLFPNYNSGFKSFFCAYCNDRPFDPMCALGPKEEHPLEPFLPANTKEVISYSYSYDNRTGTPAPWTTSASPMTRLLADKKAGLPIDAAWGCPRDKVARHFERRFLRGRRYGRYVAALDGHVELIMSEDALDPDPADAVIGPPGAITYTDWWSDPPFYDE